MSASWPVKLLVAATPISGPQFVDRQASLALASDDVVTLTIDSILAPWFLASLTESSTSAVSPLCEIATSTELPSIDESAYCDSLDTTVSDLILPKRASMCLKMSAEWW